MGSLIDMTGMRVGRLVVVARAVVVSLKPKWLCRCDCGREVAVLGSDLRRGATQSCGCLRNDRVREVITKHGDARRRNKRPEYNVWLAMKARCLNASRPDFHYYGGRGIAVCGRWAESYENFISDVGPRPSSKHTIDRIDVNGDYEPGNVRWATWSEQRRNTREYLQRHGAANAT